MPEHYLREYTQEEYEADLKEKLSSKGLYDCVRDILDEMIDEVRGESHVELSLMFEWATNILKLINLAERMKGGE